MARAGLVFLAAFALAGCVTPLTTKQVTTLGEVDMANMVCRREAPLGSHKEKTTCASPEAWAVYDKQQAAVSETLFEYARQLPNVDKFNRGP
jgi:hypothetical protein